MIIAIKKNMYSRCDSSFGVDILKLQALVVYLSMFILSNNIISRIDCDIISI